MVRVRNSKKYERKGNVKSGKFGWSAEFGQLSCFDMSPCSVFIISHLSFQHLTNFLNKMKNDPRPKYQAKVGVIFSQLHFLNFNNCSRPSDFYKCAKCVILSHDRILHDLF